MLDTRDALIGSIRSALSGKTADQELRAVTRELCSRSLLEFVRLFWPVVEPGRELVDGWWLEAWCKHLEAVTDGKITRLLGNCPPGFMKSLLTNVFWPAWEWGPRRMPWLRYVTFSYAQYLTIRDNQRTMMVVLSPLYRELWGDVFTATENKIKFENNRTGWKFATSLGGVGTGERGDRLIIDDPNNIHETESETVRAETNRWLREVMPSRLNDPQTSAIVVIQQRTHSEDASGTLLASKATKWTHVMVPMRFEPRRKCRTLIWEDPRKEDGELAWPERFPKLVVDREEVELGPYAYAGQFMQAPSPRGGGIIKREWWQMWPPAGDEASWEFQKEGPDGRPITIQYLPSLTNVVVGIDMAYLQKEENDYCACTAWGRFLDRSNRPKIMLAEAWHARLNLRELAVRTIETCQRRKADVLLIGVSGGAGHLLAQEVRRLMRKEEWQIVVDAERLDKAARLHATVPLFAGGIIYTPEPTPTRKWVSMVLEEVSLFPRGKHDDIVDTLSSCLRYMRKVGLAQLTVEAADEETEELRFRSNKRSIADEFGV